jgi:peptide deformylase
VTDLPIVQLGHPALRTPTTPVVRFDRRLATLIDDMVDTMRAAPGVGLAANQIGRSERVCVIEVEGRLWELVNPRLERVDGRQQGTEGCLSLAGYWAELARADRARASGFDRRGRRVVVGGEGLLARAIQHELDHLDGKLYIDRLPSLDGLVYGPRPPGSRAGDEGYEPGRTADERSAK